MITFSKKMKLMIVNMVQKKKINRNFNLEKFKATDAGNLLYKLSLTNNQIFKDRNL